VTPRPVQIVIDATDVDALCDFWVVALGYERFGSFEQYRSAVPPDGVEGPKFIFQRVPEAARLGKNRLHIDIAVGDEVESEAVRLEALGARRLSAAIDEAGTSWIVMADPEGNEFCLVHH
jgi:predicted enzyme related to lactoylglutathione lyase